MIWVLLQEVSYTDSQSWDVDPIIKALKWHGCTTLAWFIVKTNYSPSKHRPNADQITFSGAIIRSHISWGFSFRWGSILSTGLFFKREFWPGVLHNTVLCLRAICTWFVIILALTTRQMNGVYSWLDEGEDDGKIVRELELNSFFSEELHKTALVRSVTVTSNTVVKTVSICTIQLACDWSIGVAIIQ